MKERGFSLIISLDSIEKARSGRLDRSLRRLGLLDSITVITSTVLTNSHTNGSNLLEAIWVSSYVELKTTTILPHSLSVGDHRAILIEISRSCLLRSSYIPLLPLKMRPLISSNFQSLKNYLTSC